MLFRLLLGLSLVMSVLSFSLMGVDKRRAQQGRWRISERTLLLCAALFGALGGLLGMRCFRHKTRHNKFRLGLPAMLLVQIILLWWAYTV